MSLINVRSDVGDAVYRYKMERLSIKIEGNGNGIKTVVVNLSNVAQSLARPGSYLIKYFGFELGAQTNIDPPNDRWIINGAHDGPKLQGLLDGFIRKFVLCHRCKNPETDVYIKDGRIVLDCKACGHCSDVDLRLKLSFFILKNVPKNSGDDLCEDGSGKENGDHGADVVSEDDDALTRKIKTEAQELNNEVEVKDDKWAVDMNPEAVKACQQSLPDEFKQKLTLSGKDKDKDGEGGRNTVYNQLAVWIQDQAKEKGSIDKVDNIAIYVKAKELGIEAKHRTVLVLVQTLFDNNVLAQIGKRADMLKQIVSSDRHEKALLGGTERLICSLAKEHPWMFAKIVDILQLYYHHDLVSEEVVTKWGIKASKKYVDLATSKKIRRAAEPFLKWLAEAEEEVKEGL